VPDHGCLPAQVLNTFYFLVGYLGFLSTWIMDTIFTFVRNPTLDWYNGVTSHTLRALSPHFVLARGLYDISQVALLLNESAAWCALLGCWKGDALLPSGTRVMGLR
jgi:hypothetical protein